MVYGDIYQPIIKLWSAYDEAWDAVPWKTVFCGNEIINGQTRV